MGLLSSQRMGRYPVLWPSIVTSCRYTCTVCRCKLTSPLLEQMPDATRSGSDVEIPGASSIRPIAISYTPIIAVGYLRTSTTLMALHFKCMWLVTLRPVLTSAEAFLQTWS